MLACAWSRLMQARNCPGRRDPWVCGAPYREACNQVSPSHRGTVPTGAQNCWQGSVSVKLLPTQEQRLPWVLYAQMHHSPGVLSPPCWKGATDR